MGIYGRLTSRCEDLLKTIALNISCEAVSIINRKCGEIIGIEDLAYKSKIIIGYSL